MNIKEGVYFWCRILLVLAITVLMATLLAVIQEHTPIGKWSFVLDIVLAITIMKIWGYKILIWLLKG